MLILKIHFSSLVLGICCFPFYSQPCAGCTSRLILPSEGSPPRVLLVVTSHGKPGDSTTSGGYWLSEVTRSYKQFTDAGFIVNIASPGGGNAPVDKNSFNYLNTADRELLNNPEFKVKINATVPLKQVHSANYEAVFFAGGYGPMWDFPDDADIQRITREIYEKGGVVGAVCHGLAALLNVRLNNQHYLLEEKTITCITNEEEKELGRTGKVPFILESELLKRNARITKAAPWQANSELSSRVVTGQNPASVEKAASEIVKLLAAKTGRMPEDRFWKLMNTLAAMGKFIAAVSNEGASANTCGKFRVYHDGKENVFGKEDCEDHIHLQAEHLYKIKFSYIDVGYGPEPCLEFLNHSQTPFLKLYYTGSGTGDQYAAFMRENTDIARFITGTW